MLTDTSKLARVLSDGILLQLILYRCDLIKIKTNFFYHKEKKRIKYCFFLLDTTASRLEILPNEILVRIFSHLSWFDTLTSFWSLNIRFNSLICSTLTTDNNGLCVTRGLSYKKCSSIFVSLILNSSSLLSSIKRIHFNGTNSSADNICYQWLFNNEHILVKWWDLMRKTFY